MKKTILTKTMLLSIALCGMLATTSCKQEPKAEDTKEVAEDQNEVKFDDTNDAKEDDSEYLVAAASTDMAEVELGKLATSKGTDPEVKKLGQMMIDAHTKASEDLKPFAAKRNISLPMALTDKGKEMYDDLNDEKVGIDFDKKYAEMMVKGHEDAISKMQDAGEKATDPEIRDWAQKMIPGLQEHLGNAKMVETKIKSKK